MAKELFCLCKEKEEENEINTYHIFEECEKSLYNKCYTPETESVCGMLEDNNLDCLLKLTCRDRQLMRTKIAELANEGNNICGVCVSHLYKNN